MAASASHTGWMAFEDRLFDARRLRLYPPTILALYLLALILVAAKGEWLTDAQGGFRLTDFAWLWVGGRLALSGRAIQAFDYDFFAAAQAAVPLRLPAGGEFFHWIYPPTLFFCAIPFALLPYLAGFAAWVGTTLALYLSAVHAILRRRPALLMALVPFPVIANVYFGHTGFLVAGLLGMSLALMDKRPFAAGLVLGLLSFKPQLGLLFPVVLLAAGQWRIIAGAAVSVLFLAAAAALAFGAASWLAFAASLGQVNPQTLMPDDHLVAVLQTVFGFMRWAGCGVGIAWAAHLTVAAGVAAAVCLTWRRPVSPPLKAAALGAGTLIVTPYLMIYDLVAITLPAAFLVRAAWSDGFLPGERSLLLTGAIALTVFYWLPIGPFVLAALLVAILRRALFTRSPDGSNPFEHRDQPETGEAAQHRL